MPAGSNLREPRSNLRCRGRAPKHLTCLPRLDEDEAVLNISRCPQSFQKQTTPTPDALTTLLSAIRLCLQFSVTDEHSDQTTPAVLPDIRAVKTRELMTSLFFEKLYVNRPEIEQLHSKVGIKRLVLIDGFVGCGKSTLFQKFHRELLARKVDHVIIDLQANLLVATNQQSTQAGVTLTDVDQQLAQSVYRLLTDKIVSQYIEPDDGIRQEWRHYRFQHDPKFARLLDSIRVSEDKLPQTPAEWEAALAKPIHQQIRTECLKSLPNHQEELACTLRFLRRYVADLNVLIDNIDQLRIAAQRDIMQTFSQLCVSGSVSITPFVAIRRENYRRIMRISQNAETDAFSTYERVTITTGLEDLRVDKSASATRLISNFLSMRINFMKDHQADIFESKDVEDWARSSFNVSMTGLLDRVLNLTLQQLNYAPVKRVISNDLFYWHNQGLRSIAIHAYNLLEMYIASHDKELSASDVFGKHIGSRADVRIDDKAFRTAFYRHTILRLRGPSAPKSLVWFDSLENAASQKGLLYHLPLRILQILLVRQDGETKSPRRDPVTIGEIRTLFSDFNVERKKVDDALAALKRPRGYDPNGLIFVDFPLRRLEVSDLRDDVAVTLLPSGFYYMKRLRFMVEYLFWSIMYLEEKAYQLSSKTIPEADLYSQVWKTKQVCRFAAEVLAKRAEDEAKKWSGLKVVNKTLFEKSRRIFMYEGSQLTYISKLHASIRAYIPSEARRDPTVLGYLSQLEEADRKIADLMRR
jgi:hypothetical protein